jgi:endonuclease YncB( thermonuclease family)
VPTDTIIVSVTAVIDGDTFVAEVEAQEARNREKYKSSERIRIANIEAAELPSRQGRTDKEKLEQAIRGKRLRCAIQSRDAYGRLVCKISRP